MGLPDKDILQNNENRMYDPTKGDFITYPVNLPKPTIDFGGTSGPSDNSSDGAFNRMMFLASPINKPKVSASSTFTYNPVEIPTRYSKYLLGMDNENIQHELQSGWDRIGNAAMNFAQKTGAYLLQTAGFIAGAVPAAVGGVVNLTDDLFGGKGDVVEKGNAVSLMTDNFLVNLGDLWKEHVQEAYPIYKGKAYTEGNIWQKLGSTDWWLDDFTDRLALTASMLVPGFAETRGVGLFGAVADEAGALKATGIGSKGLQALADNPSLYGKLGKMLGNQVYKTAVDGTVDMVGSKALAFKNLVQTAQKLELYSWNVIGQSGLNAREAQVGIKRALIEQREQGLNSLTDDQIEQKAAEGAAKGFWYTAPLALAGSLYELPQIFSSAKMAQSSLKKFFNPQTMEVLEGATKTVKPSMWKILGKAALTGLEHGQNESAQVAVGRYLEESIAGKIKDGRVEKDDSNPFVGIFKNFIDNVNDPNGQNNIALGTIQGMLMTFGGHAKSLVKGQYKAQDAANKKFIDTINNAVAERRFWATPENFVEKDDNGKIKLHPDGSPVFNQQKLADMGMSMVGAAEAYQQKMEAIKNNDVTTLERLNFNSLSALSQNFFDDPKGVEYLTNVLRFEAKNQSENINRENDVKDGIEITPDRQLQENLQHVQSLKKAYDAIENRHAGFTELKIDSKNKDEVTAKAVYMDRQKNAQYWNAANQIWIESKIRKNDIELASIGVDSYIDKPSTPEEARANDIIDENNKLSQELDQWKEGYKDLTDKTKYKERFELIKETVAKTKELIEKKKEEADAAITEDPAIGKTVKVKTKDGEETLEIGVEYYLGKRVFKDKNGNEFYSFPKLTILGENPDGTIKIKGSDGIERDVSKDVLLEYKLGKVSDTDNNKKAKFFVDHSQMLFEHYGIKIDGKPARGTLEYSPKKGVLIFKYKDKKGKEQTREVTGDMFKAKEGFQHAMIAPVEKLTPEQSKSMSDFSNEKDQRREVVREITLKVLSDLSKEVDGKLQNTKNLIEQKVAEVKRIDNELLTLEEKIKKGELTKRNNFKSTTNKAIKAANRLSRMQEQLHLELEQLNAEQENLENARAYIADMAQNVDELPMDRKELLEELNEQQLNLEILHEDTGKQISAIVEMINQTDATLQSAVNMVRDLIEQFQKAYPKAPTAIFGKEWVDFLQANPNFLKINTKFKEDLATVEDIIAQIDDFEIAPNERFLADLRTEFDKLQKQLADLEKEIAAKEVILNKFQAVEIAYEKQLEEEAKISKNEALWKEVLGTLNSSVRNRTFTKKFEPDSRKSDMDVVKSSTFPTTKSTGGEPVPSHVVRSNAFGARIVNFSNELRNGIRGVLITSENQAKLIPGLMEHLIGDKKGIKAENIIALVMVRQDAKGVLHLVDEFGQDISTEGMSSQDVLDSSVYQVMPENIETLFREGTNKTVKDDLIKQYKEWRSGILGDNSIVPYNIQASFGFPDYVQKLDDKGNPTGRDYNARVPVTDSALIAPSDLSEVPVLYIPTTEETITRGSTSHTNALGRVFLRLPNAYVEVDNRKHTEQEASAIFDVMHALSKMMAKDGTIKSVEGGRLVNWLRSVVYWGTPKGEGGYNSVWFEKTEDGYKLFMSGKNTPVSLFTPTDLTEKKEEIVGLLTGMYLNVNNFRTEHSDAWNTAYEQILSVDENGNVKTKIWKNYQTYLLSNKDADGKTERKGEQIPLTTNIRPVENVGANAGVNRKGIYFTINDKANDSKFVEPKPAAAKPTTPILTPGAPKPTTAEAKPSEKPSAKFDVEAKQTNTISLQKGNLTFKYDKSKPDAEAVIDLNIDEPLIKQLVEKNNIVDVTGEDGTVITANEIAESNYYAYVLKTVKADIEATAKIEEQVAKQKEAIASAETKPSESIIDNQQISEEKRKLMDEQEKDIPEDPEYRVVVENQIKQFERENWDVVEKDLKEIFPNIPVYRVKNMIKGANGTQAFGMFKNGALYIARNAEVGTVYHEVMHAIFNMTTTPAERKVIYDEYRNREGSFEERNTRKNIKYTEATDKQIRELMSEEFRNYMLKGEIPARAKQQKSAIVKFFSDLWNIIKTFFVGPQAQSNVEKLFKNIKEGKYKTFVPEESKLSFAKEGIIDIDDAYATPDAELSEIPGFTADQEHDIMQHLTYMTLVDLITDNKSIFEIPKINKEELYAKLLDNLQKTALKAKVEAKKNIELKKVTADEAASTIATSEVLWNNITDRWAEIRQKHEDVLKQYDIEFDENDQLNINDENRTGRNEYDAAEKIDHYRKAPVAIKLLCATLPMVDSKGNLINSSIGGVKLIPSSQVWMAIMNEVSGTLPIMDKLEKLRLMAVYDKNYERLYKRLTKTSSNTNTIDLRNLEQHDLQLLTAFNRSFTKFAPDVKIFHILENGETQIGESNLSSAARQIQSEFENNIKGILRNPKNKYFEYNTKEKAFVAKKGAVDAETLATPKLRVAFLQSLGIEFDVNDIKNLEVSDPIAVEKFNKAVGGLKRSMQAATRIATITGKVLDIRGVLLTLAEIKAKIENPEFSSTFFDVNGERVQTYIGTNLSSDFFNSINTVNNLNQLLTDPKFKQFAYLVTDSFSGKNGHSVILNKMFNLETGNRISDSKALMQPAVADGMNNQSRGKKKSSARLNFRERILQQVTMMQEGYYYNLVVGDASREYMTYMGNHITPTTFDAVYDIFKGYLIDEIELARENRPVAKDRKSNELRFFNSILDTKLHNDIMRETKMTAEEIVNSDKYKNKIDRAVEKFILNEAEEFKKTLETYKIASPSGEGKYSLDTIKFTESSEMSEVDFIKHLNSLTANFMINNIELHKLLYSDPYQYSDELKRIKNFNSPRQAVISNSPEMNAAFNNVWNRGYKPGDIGYTNFDVDYLRTVTMADIKAISKTFKDYGVWDEGDGGGAIMFKAYRNYRIHEGSWTDADEAQYRYDVAWEKRDKKKGLSPEEQTILKNGNPKVQTAYTPLKPIVSGNKANNRAYNDVILDKFALYPLSYRILKEINSTGGKENSNAVEMYNKLQNENLDYFVFDSGRKVGAETLNDIYDNGAFNQKPYEGVVNVPFAIMSTQSEVPAKEENVVTLGSQATKELTMDYLEAGIPIDFKDSNGKTDFSAERYEEWYNIKDEAEKERKSPLYKEIKNNQVLLQEMLTEGYNVLLNKLGIKEIVLKDGRKRFEITDKLSKAAKTLRDEILKREVNNNIISALNGFLKGDAILEATPAYQQVRNILYSIVDKNISSPKINGGFKVQLPVSLLESVKAERVEIGDKVGYQSDTLKFYEDEDGKRHCEIMVKRWFKSDKTDKQLLDEWYKTDKEGNKVLTEEGRKILGGIAFRTPTQKQNSIDVFVIKQFLPEEFGDAVIIPSELVKKAGSDFDIDKLSIYLKNVFSDSKGDIKLIPFLGFGQQAKNKFGEMYDNGEFLTKDQMQELDRIIEEEKDILFSLQYDAEGKPLGSAKDRLLGAIFAENYSDEVITRDFVKSITKEGFREKFINNLYKKSLENEYIQSSENLVSHELNFKRLTSPNSSEQLKKIAADIVEQTGGKTFDYKNVGNMLSINFMTTLRHAFVTGKYAIGIAATAQTNNAQNQRAPIYIDVDKLSYLNSEDQYWLKDGKIKFDRFNQIEITENGKKKMVTTLSLPKNVDGDFISDIISQFIDGYVDISKGPWIMQLGANPNVAGTFLFLAKIGIPADTLSYFMNQPIIRDYLRSVENAGYSYLFMQDFVNNIKDSEKYRVDGERLKQVPTTLPDKTTLFENIKLTKFTPDQKAEQQFILDEFLKYAMMADHLRQVIQGTNFDTANLNDPFLIFKKKMELARARNTIISSPDAILDNSYIGELASKLYDSRDALSTILLSDQSSVRDVLEQVLTPYINLQDNDFVKLARKAVSDLFDWAVQINGNKNTFIQSLLLDENSAVKQINDFKNSIAKDPTHALYRNHIIGKTGILTAEFGDKMQRPDNLMLTNRDNKVYDQNMIIQAFREVREYLIRTNNESLYKKIVGVSLLQSGLSTSKISFTHLLPYEDFVKQYNSTLSKLQTLGDVNLNDFKELNVFERNNWNNDDITPYEKATPPRISEGGRLIYNTRMSWFGSKQNVAISKAIGEGKIPQLLRYSTLSRAGKSDVIVYTWENMALSKSQKREMKKQGDFSYINKGLFKKVYYPDGTPVISSYLDPKTGEVYDSYVYKMINAWGDSYRTNEFYNTERPSVIDNGFIKVEDKVEYSDTPYGPIERKTSPERSDETISQYFSRQEAENPLPLKPVPTKKAEKPVINIYWGSPESSTNTKVLSNLAPRKFTYQGKEYGSVEHAYQTLKSGSFDQATYDKYVKAGGYGTKIRGKAVQKGFDNLQLMRDLVVESFKQNPEQAKLLLNYSDFTHTTNEVIDKAFLDGIRLAQKNAELAALEGAKLTKEIKLKDGVTYRATAINANMLEKMGYAPEEIGKILKQLC